MILVTGGAGYIGSHTCVELLSAGYDLVVLDNLSNSSIASLERVAGIVNVECSIFNVDRHVADAPHDDGNGDDERLTFIQGDIRDRGLLRSVFERFEIEAVVHFAGLKAVGESVAMPLRYYDNNVLGSVALFEVMAEFGCKRVVFSSSATVYGDPASVPIREDFPLSTTNPYGASKLMVENILRDVAASDAAWSIGLLRYFNPVGAHESGLMGEDPNGIPSNLLPYIAQVAVGKLPELAVFGKDYSTPDGTGVRDYIHVVDLAEGHLKALESLKTRTGAHVWNLGTGQGYSVLEMIRAFEAASGKSIPYRIAPRRPGDIATCYADPTKAERELGWKSRRGLDQMMQDAWCWQRINPIGFKT